MYHALEFGRPYTGGQLSKKETLDLGVEPSFRAELASYYMTSACTNRYTSQDM
jgi:hypothetical protein